MKNPEIRFIDDNIDWQNKKIEDILEPYAEKNINNYPSVAIGRYGIRKREEIYSKELTKDTTKNKVINKNTLTIGMGSTQIDIGILHTDEHFSVSPAYHTFNILDNDSKFIESSFAKNNEKYSKQHMIIGARQGKSVDFPNFLTDTIYLPPMKVQQEIASLLTNIEDKITKQENLIQKLKDTKSSLLLKMFPQENQSVPELRFDGFTNDWEQHKLSDIFEERHTISTISDEYPQLSFTIADGVIRPEDRKTNKRDFLIIDKANKKYLITEYDDIIYNPANVIFGAIHRNALGKGCVSPIYKIFHTDFDSKFMECIVRNESFINKISQNLEGTVTKLKTLKSDAFLNMSSHITTSMEEQTKIGDLFKILDNLITLHQHKPFHLNFSL